MTAIPLLNDWLIERAEHYDFVPRWNRLRLVAASLHSVHENERQMLFEHIHRLSSSDLLLLDRGYPCRWLVAVLNQRKIPFCMRVEKSANSGFTCVPDFLRNGLSEQVLTLRASDRRDVLDFECPSAPQTVRLIRQIAPNGQVRVLMTNLFDVARFPACSFGELYHQRWDSIWLSVLITQSFRVGVG